MRQLRVVLPNTRCNLKCKYCIDGYNNSDKRISTKDVDLSLMIKKAKHYTFDNISIWGGEPLMNRALWKVIAELKKNFPDKPIHLLTNGVLLIPQYIDTLNKYDVHVSISHDANAQNFRYHYDFLQDEAYINNINKLKHFEGFNSVIHKHNCNFLDIYNYFKALPINGDWTINFELFEVNNSEQVKYIPSVDEYEIMYKSLKELICIYKETGDSKLKNLSRYFNILSRESKFRCAADNRITIDCYGNLWLCQVCAENNIHSDGRYNLSDTCLKCNHVSKCKGICPVMPEMFRRKLCMFYHTWYDALSESR